MPNDRGYAITDMASLAGVTPRTIRYYVSVGLIPAPKQAGRAARYDEDHLRRLRLIRRLQEQHLPLAEIRSRLSSLTDDEVAAALAAPQPEPGSALDYIRSLTSRSPKRVAEAPPIWHTEVPAAPHPAPLPLPLPGPAPSRPPTTKPVAAMWERIPLTPDVELHVRRPLSRSAHKRVERLVTIAREILEDRS